MKTIIRAAFVAALLSTAATVAFAPTPVLAQAAPPKMTTAVQNRLAEASKLIEANKLDEALAKVNEAQAQANLNDTDKYNINRFVGLISFKKDDFAGASAAYDAMARSPVLAAADRVGVLRSAAGLSMQ